jgi:hypothetical protein
MTSDPIRVLLAEDQAIVRAGFRALLNAEPDLQVAGEAADGREAVALARELRPDLVLMDIRMPELDGLEATRQITATRTHVIKRTDRRGSHGLCLSDPLRRPTVRPGPPTRKSDTLPTGSRKPRTTGWRR